MAREVCFIKEGQVATCILSGNDDNMPCEKCPFNPFPGKKIPENRILIEEEGND